MNLVIIVIGLILLQYYVFTMMVGAARGKAKIDAPAMTGEPKLERTLRIQLNTLEQIVVVIPTMWIYGHYISEMVSAILGVVFIVGRIIYCKAYLADPKKRSVGFSIGFLATIILLIGSLYGAIAAAI